MTNAKLNSLSELPKQISEQRAFNLISLESGKIRKRIQAHNYDEAVSIAENMNYCMDDYMIETTQETEKQRAMQTRWWNLQTL